MLTALALASALLAKGEAYVTKEVAVVDGDTLRVDGIKVRIANLDTPERGARAASDAERFLAVHASKRAEVLVRGSTIAIIPEGRADRYDRPLIRVRVNGKDWADIMIEENLAVRWSGAQHDWCGDARAH